MRRPPPSLWPRAARGANLWRDTRHHTAHPADAQHTGKGEGEGGGREGRIGAVKGEVLNAGRARAWGCLCVCKHHLGCDTRTHETQTDRQTGRQTGRQADRQAGRQTDRQTDTHTHTQTDRQTDRHTHTHTLKQTGRHTDIHRRTPSSGVPKPVGVAGLLG